jgi:hypothetical protein
VVVFHLVDSNVFLRSLILSREAAEAAEEGCGHAAPPSAPEATPEYEPGELRGVKGFHSLIRPSEAEGLVARAQLSLALREDSSYLVHSWEDVPAISVSALVDPLSEEEVGTRWWDRAASREGSRKRSVDGAPWNEESEAKRARVESGRTGWDTRWKRREVPGRPRVPRRFHDFLAQNEGHLLKSLMGSVDLSSVNHENICCLNTALLMLIFAYRR